MKIVAYVGNNEILITSKKNEENFLREYFSDTGRDVDDYDRSQFKDDDSLVLDFTSVLKMDYSRAPGKS